MRDLAFNTRPWTRAGLAFCGWTLLGLFDTGPTLYKYAYVGDPVPWWRVLGMCLTLWYAWATLAVVIFWIPRRFPLEGGAWR